MSSTGHARGAALTFTVLSAVIALSSGLALVYPQLSQPGLSSAADVPLHVGNVVQSSVLLTESPLSWSWLPDIAGGYGGPNYLFYGSLGFVVPAFMVRCGLQPLHAIKAWTIFCFLISAISALLWCSLSGSWAVAPAAAALYLWGPYYFGLVYSRGAYPEFVAASFYPLLFYTYHKALLRGGFHLIASAALLFAWIVAVHTLSLIIVTPFLVMEILLLSLVNKRVTKVLTRGAAVFSLAVAFGGSYLVGPFLALDTVTAHHQFRVFTHFVEHAIPFYSLFNSSGAGDSIVARILPGRLHLVLLLLSIVYCCASGAYPHRQRVLTLGHATIAAVALFVILPLGAALLELLCRSVTHLQFPGRYLSMFNLFVVGTIARVIAQMPLWQRWIATLVIPIVCVVMYYQFIPAQHSTTFPTDTQEKLRNSLSTLDHENKYMPVGARLPLRPRGRNLLVLSGEGNANLVRSRINDYTFLVEVGAETRAIFQQYYFPGWQLMINGAQASLRPEPDMGLCAFDVPAGIHEVRLVFRATGAYRVARIVATVSLGGSLLAIALSILLRRRWKASSSTSV